MHYFALENGHTRYTHTHTHNLTMKLILCRYMPRDCSVYFRTFFRFKFLCEQTNAIKNHIFDSKERFSEKRFFYNE
jgi:hypothetical protein